MEDDSTVALVYGWALVLAVIVCAGLLCAVLDLDRQNEELRQSQEVMLQGKIDQGLESFRATKRRKR